MGGRFDALLAEAVRSSKAASTALEDARAENDARMLEAGRTISLAGRRGELVGSGQDKDRGAGDSEIGCSGKSDYAVVDAAHGARTGTRGKLGSQTCGSESGSNGHPQAPRAVATASGNASLSINPRLTPEPCAPPLAQPKITRGNHDGIYESDNMGESRVPRDLASPRRAGSSEGACGLDSSSWACLRCTLVNPRESTSCQACGYVPSLPVNVLKGAVTGGGTQTGTNPSAQGHPTDSAAEAVVDGASAAVFSGPAEGDLREASGQTAGVEPPPADLQATEGVRAPTGGSPRPRRTARTTPAPLRAAAAAFPPDSSPPPPGRVSSSKERRTHFVRRNPAAAEALLRTMSPSTAAICPSESTRASGSAPQPCRGKCLGAPCGGSGALERDHDAAGRMLPIRARHTAPAVRSDVPFAVGTTEVAAAQGPRRLRSPATFVPADIHPPMQPRGRKDATAAPQGGRGVRQHHPQHASTLHRVPRRRTAKPHAFAVRRRLMGPPRRLGGMHRPSRLHHVPPPSSVTPPATATTTAVATAEAKAVAAAAALTPGLPSLREMAGLGHDHRHDREQSEGSLRPFSPLAPSSRAAALRGGSGRGGRGDTAVASGRPPPSSAAPACDVSLSILGWSQARGGKPRGGGAMLCGGYVSSGGAEAGGGGVRRSEHETASATSFQQKVGGGIGGVGAWGRRCGAGEGDGRAAAAAAAVVGVAPLKLRRRVNDTRTLEPLVAR